MASLNGSVLGSTAIRISWGRSTSRSPAPRDAGSAAAVVAAGGGGGGGGGGAGGFGGLGGGLGPGMGGYAAAGLNGYGNGALLVRCARARAPGRRLNVFLNPKASLAAALVAPARRRPTPARPS